MSDSPTSEPESAFVCDCIGFSEGITRGFDYSYMRAACVEEPFYKEHEGLPYCVLHFPGKEKSVDFKTALHRKLDNKDFNFRGLWFPDELSFDEFNFSAEADFSFATFSAEVNFSSVTFSTEASFRSAIFSAGASFIRTTFTEKADFGSATFNGFAFFYSVTFSAAADFNHVTFSATARFFRATFNSEASFRSAILSAEAFFNETTFSTTASFTSATFRAEADFNETTFSAAAHFNAATFADHVRFEGTVFTDTSSLDLQFARIEESDHVSFHTLSLRPYWFVNVDPRKFDFTNVDWDWRNIEEEVASLQGKFVSPESRLLSIACWHLAVNAEENRRYEEASKFRYMAMDVRRRERWRGWTFWRLSWWYWVASGYGERALQALIVLIGIWLLSGMLYSSVGFARWEPKLSSESDVVNAKRDDLGAPLRFSRALTYSAGVMTLQKPEPRPATSAAQTVVLLEVILGPAQAALLALAIRRRFMR
jgi:hypothetical protein